MPVRLDIGILLVDDNNTTRTLLREILEYAGFHNITEAESGDAAWSSLGQKNMELVITDWNMRPMDGLTLLQRIRNTPDTQNIPVIMLTVNTQKKYVDKALKNGANNFIAKPFDRDLVIKKINMIFDRTP
ncbi:MAG: response regulator [SAR324 cluster bacterium]|nr:response regulator [SAR324 cluster bacterium]